MICDSAEYISLFYGKLSSSSSLLLSMKLSLHIDNIIDFVFGHYKYQ